MLPARQSYFLCLYLSNIASPGISLDAGEVLPARQILLSLSLPVQQSKSWYLVGRRRGAPGQTNLTFPVFTCPTQQVLISCWTPARCSQPDKRSSLCSHQKYRTPSNATYPAVLASLVFSPPPARLHHPAHKYQSHLRCRKSLPAGQPHLFLLRQRS